MEREGCDVVTARAPAGERQDETIFGALQSGYVRRGNTQLPRQGRDLPWRVLHNYERDRPMLVDEPIEDEALIFERQPSSNAASPPINE
jgi:hypothetical protein